MAPHNFDPSNVTAGSQMQRAVSEEPQAGQAGQEVFEQHLREAGEAHVGIPSRGSLSRFDYPFLSDVDRNLIHSVFQDAVASGGLGPVTAGGCTSALGRLGNHLGSQSETINELNHSSLAAHAEQSFPRDAKMRHALKALQEYRGGTGHLIKAAMQEAIRSRGVKPGTAKNHATALRQLAKSLESSGETLAGLDHETLLDRAKAAFPRDKRFRPALVSLSKYLAAGDSVGRTGAGEDASGADGSRQAASSPMLALVPEELRRLSDDRPDESSVMALPSPRSGGFPAEVWDLFDDAAEEPPTNPVELQRLEQSFREELHGRRDDQRVHSGLAFDAEQFPPAKLRRVLNHLDDRSTPSPASVEPTEFLRLQEQIHNEIQRQPDDQPSRSFFVDQEEFNLEQFSPGAPRRLLDVEPAQPQVPVNPTHLNAGAGVLMQAPLDELEGPPTMQHSGHEQPAALNRSGVLASDDNRSTSLVINTDRYRALFVPAGMTRLSTPLHPPSAASGFGSRSENAPQPNALSGNQASPALPSRRWSEPRRPPRGLRRYSQRSARLLMRLCPFPRTSRTAPSLRRA
ncbi:hypothetical protein [Bradyrhizobium sp. USDA 3256]